MVSNSDIGIPFWLRHRKYMNRTQARKVETGIEESSTFLKAKEEIKENILLLLFSKYQN